MADQKPGAMRFSNLHERARELLHTGALPREPAQRTFAGYGDGTACLLCSSPIGPGEVEYELEFGREDKRIVDLHLACHAIWEYERQVAGDRGR
jgi:hypothetical protein